MVRKKLVRMIMLVAVIVCVCTPTALASTHNTYTDGTPSSTYINYFKDISEGIPTTHNYVAVRSGQYEYILHTSDTLELSNGKFTSEGGNTYIITVGSGYNSSYNYNVGYEPNFVLNTNNQMVYSDLGEYPRLVERGSSYEFATLLAIFVFGICTLIRPMFNFVNRTR